LCRYWWRSPTKAGGQAGDPFATPSAERMRQYRRRRRWKRLLVRVELDATEIGVLVSRGYLNPREKENLEAIQQAANDFISDAMLL